MTTLRSAVLAFAALALVACKSTDSDNAMNQPAPAAGEMPDMAAMEAMMAELATPGAEHAHLEPMIGEWDAAMTFRMTPDMPPMESSGDCVNAWTLGKRFVETTFNGTFMDMPFEGRGFMGYDKSRKTYCGFWIDNSGTLMMQNSTGTYSAEDRTFRMRRSFVDPMTGDSGELREVITIHSDDHHTFEMWMAMDGQEPFKTMQAEYTRKG